MIEYINCLPGASFEDKICNFVNEKNELSHQLSSLKADIQRQKEHNKLLEESCLAAPLASPSLLISSQNGINVKLLEAQSK